MLRIRNARSRVLRIFLIKQHFKFWGNDIKWHFKFRGNDIKWRFKFWGNCIE